MTTSNDPDEIRADIERTRAALSDDVDDLAESVKPKNVAGRQVGKVKEAASNLKDRVMGSDDDDYSGSAVGTVSDRAYAAKDAVADRAYRGSRTRTQRESVRGTRGRQAGAGDHEAEDAGQSPGRRRDRLRPGNAGVLADSFQREGAGGRLQLQDNLEPVKEKASEVARDIGESLKPAAQEAAESVKTTAQEGVESVKQEGQSAAHDVKDQAQASKETVQQQPSS